MAPKKKQPYVYFCLQKQQVDPGLKGKTLPELIDLCSEEWKSMNLVQRKPFIDTATLLTENPMAEPSFSSRQSIEASPLEDMNGKFDGFGRSFVALQSSIIQEKSTYMYTYLLMGHPTVVRKNGGNKNFLFMVGSKSN